MSFIKVYSEIGKIKRVLLQRPGIEIENISPSLMKTFLFDDIPYLKIAQKEHKIFAKTLEKEKIEIFYFDKLLQETIENKKVKEDLKKDYLKKNGFKEKTYAYKALSDYLLEFNDKSLIEKIITGIRKNELKIKDFESKNEFFYTNPLPNIYFTRDPAFSLGKSFTISNMNKKIRSIESLFSNYILKHNPKFKNIKSYSNKNGKLSIEGGDILILSSKIILIGISERTKMDSVKEMIEEIFKNDKFETVICVEIPKIRSFMHLDTVFTALDYDKFIIHPPIEKLIQKKEIKLKTMEKINSEGGFIIKEQEKDLKKLLENYLKTKIDFIYCGDNDKLHAEREQWNDGANTLAIEPGKVICYNRNHMSNKALKDAGIKILEIDSSELSKGRGGPRCMSMPLYRE